MSSMKRIRVHIDYATPQRNRRSWFLFDSAQCRIVSDLSYLITKRFGLKNEASAKLEMDGYSLPPSESIDIIRDNDSVTVIASFSIDLAHGFNSSTSDTTIGRNDSIEPLQNHSATSIVKPSVSKWDVKGGTTLSDDDFFLQPKNYSSSTSDSTSTSSGEESARSTTTSGEGALSNNTTSSSIAIKGNRLKHTSNHSTSTSNSTVINTASITSNGNSKISNAYGSQGRKRPLPLKSFNGKPNNNNKVAKVPATCAKIPARGVKSVSISKTSMSKTGAGTHIIFTDSDSSEAASSPAANSNGIVATTGGQENLEKMECSSNEVLQDTNGSYVPFKVNDSPAVQIGDRMKYKILELSSDYTPGLSEFKEGTVVAIDPSRHSATIELSKVTIGCEAKRMEAYSNGKFSLSEETVEDVNVQNIVEVDLLEMVEPLLFVKVS